MLLFQNPYLKIRSAINCWI